MSSDFYSRVPKDPRVNMLYRIKLRDQAQRDPTVRKALMEACRADVLFWMNVFAFVYEPRPRNVNGVTQSPIVPFVTWPHQDPIILELKKHLGLNDIGIDKSRGEGMTWVLVLLALHDWIFADMAAVGLVSKNEKSADNPDNPDSLFWKIDWELTKLPVWMVGQKDLDWKRNLQDHTLRNLHTQSTISAYAATGDLARGGRKTWFFMDEFGAFPFKDAYKAQEAVQPVTDCRVYGSTPQGPEGAFADVMHQASNMVKLRMHWSDNPTKNRGLYRLVKDRAEAVDPVNNPLPRDYTEHSKAIWGRLRQKGFTLEGKVRSPWYDRECDRAGATPQMIAQELDIDYGGSVFRIFGQDFFAKAETTVRTPTHRLTVNFSRETLEPDFDESDMGRLLLWTTMDTGRKPPRHPYVLGVDICSGLGGSHTSNSCAIVYDMMTMEQVAEYVTNTEEPAEFAETCMAIGKWFGNAFLIWEVNFGGAFTNRLKEKNYPNLYYRDPEWRKGAKKKKVPGWWTDDLSKQRMFGAFSTAVRRGELILHSDLLVKECGQYRLVGEKIEHVLARSTNDDSALGRAHGDRVIAACVALMGAKDRPVQPIVSPVPEEDPMMARRREWEAAAKKDNVWDRRETGGYGNNNPFATFGIGSHLAV